MFNFVCNLIDYVTSHHPIIASTIILIINTDPTNNNKLLYHITHIRRGNIFACDRFFFACGKIGFACESHAKVVICLKTSCDAMSHAIVKLFACERSFFACEHCNFTCER